jgi:hypothetical protein
MSGRRVGGLDSEKGSNLQIIRIMNSAFGSSKALSHFGSKENMLDAQQRVASLFSNTDTEAEKVMDERRRANARNERYYQGARELKTILAHNQGEYNQDNITFDDEAISGRFMDIKRSGTNALALQDLAQFFPGIIDRENESDRKLMEDADYYAYGTGYAGARRDFMRAYPQGYVNQARSKPYLSEDELQQAQAFEMSDDYRRENHIRLKRS